MLFAICIPFFLSAQRQITWKGGAPGKTNDWNEPRNWEGGQVPGADDRVLIPFASGGDASHPIIASNVQVAEIEIQSGTTLTIAANGALTIDGEYTYSRGLRILGGNLIAKGDIVFRNVDEVSLAQLEAIELQETTAYYSNLYGFAFKVISEHTY